jgi:hypothetical protein
LTCRALHAVANPIIYRHVIIPINLPPVLATEDMIQRLSTDDSLCSLIQHIEVPSMMAAPVGKRIWQKRRKYDDQLTRLMEIIKRSKHLQGFSFAGNIEIPISLLDCLHTNRPRCRLRICKADRVDNANTLSRLSGSPILFALTAKLFNQNTTDFNELQNVVSNCPNLKELSVVSIPSNGDGGGGAPQFRSSGAFAPKLHSLDLTYFAFIPTEDHWINYADLSQLKKLRLAGDTFLPALAPRMSALKSLRVSPSNRESPLINQYLAKFKLLHKLNLWGYTKQFDRRLLEHLGQKLCILRLHDPTESYGERIRPVLSKADLEFIGKTCPHLKTLGIDINYEKDDMKPNEGSWV